MKARVRIDLLLVERGLAESREKARAMIMAGEVLVDGQKAAKAGQTANPSAEIRLLGERPRYVSRGGLKLEGALREFHLDVQGQICLDIGASTGGFTDCLLQHGAAKVYALDVGSGQLDWRIRQDDRVIVHEGINARYLSTETVPEAVRFACCDVSFISATLILPRLPALLAPGAELVVLVKPQFEVVRSEVGKGGIVRDPLLHEGAVNKVRRAVQELGFRQIRTVESPILGAEGNREFLLCGSEWNP